MTVDDFIKKCDEYNYTFKLSNIYCWNLQLKHASFDSEYAYIKNCRELSDLLNDGLKYMKHRKTL